MEPFAKGIPRLAVVASAIVVLAVMPLSVLTRGPNLCLWSHLFHVAHCPACGSTRALVAFFHARFAQAMAYNRNVAVTAPLLLWMLFSDLWQVARRWTSPPALSRTRSD